MKCLTRSLITVLLLVQLPLLPIRVLTVGCMTSISTRDALHSIRSWTQGGPSLATCWWMTVARRSPAHTPCSLRTPGLPWRATLSDRISAPSLSSVLIAHTMLPVKMICWFQLVSERPVLTEIWQFCRCLAGDESVVFLWVLLCSSPHAHEPRRRVARRSVPQCLRHQFYPNQSPLNLLQKPKLQRKKTSLLRNQSSSQNHPSHLSLPPSLAVKGWSKQGKDYLSARVWRRVVSSQMVKNWLCLVCSPSSWGSMSCLLSSPGDFVLLSEAW